VAVLVAAGVGCVSAPPPLDPQAALIAKGRRIFFNETFNGNGRTCGTCHPAENNFTLDPNFIARLPHNNPLFVAEFMPALAKNFENPRLMRELGLILENLDGFDDPAKGFVMRGIPHTLALRSSIASPAGPRTGWSGDGAPGDGSLRSFATGAVIQHFTKSLNRVAGTDFRLPSADELDALEAFQLSLGRQEDLKLPLPLKGEVARRGQEIFLDKKLGKCSFCHQNAGATADLGQGNIGNQNFDTGIEDLPDQPARLVARNVPADDGLGIPGDRTFNTPPLVEAASTPPFFHNNSMATIEAAVGFYDGDAFNESPAAKTLKKLTGGGIELDGTQIQAIASFLRVLNALEKIRQSVDLLDTTRQLGHGAEPGSALRQAIAETEHAIGVLSEAQLHAPAVAQLQQARNAEQQALQSWFGMSRHLDEAIAAQRSARAELLQ
jgi:cytochrome c553